MKTIMVILMVWNLSYLAVSEGKKIFCLIRIYTEGSQRDLFQEAFGPLDRSLAVFVKC